MKCLSYSATFMLLVFKFPEKNGNHSEFSEAVWFGSSSAGPVERSRNVVDMDPPGYTPTYCCSRARRARAQSLMQGATLVQNLLSRFEVQFLFFFVNVACVFTYLGSHPADARCNL